MGADVLQSQVLTGAKACDAWELAQHHERLNVWHGRCRLQPVTWEQPRQTHLHGNSDDQALFFALATRSVLCDEQVHPAWIPKFRNGHSTHHSRLAFSSSSLKALPKLVLASSTTAKAR